MQMINRDILTKIFDDKAFNDEVIELLNSIVDEELAKNDDDIDFDLVDECTDAVMQIMYNGKNAVESVLNIFDSKSIDVDKKRIAFKSFSTTLKVAIIAAALLLSTLTVNAALYDITGKSMFENMASITQSDKEDDASTTTQEQTTQPQTEDTTTQAPRVDDSIFVRQSSIPSMASGKSVKIADNSFDSAKFNKGEIITYKSKGTIFDNIKLNYNNPDLPQYFSESKYMEENYPVDACDVTGAKHTFTKWEIISSPSCGTLGEKRRYCTACDAEQVCPIKATGKHKMTYDFPFAYESATKPRKARATCTNCGIEAIGSINPPKYIVLDTDFVYYNGSSTQKPKIKAVLDKNGYEYPSKYWKAYYEPILTGGATWVSAEFMNDIYANYVGVRYYLHPAKINLAGITALDSGFNAYWNKSKNINDDTVSGYQMEYSLSSDFSSSTKVKIKGYNTRSSQVNGLASGSTYYVRIRTYYNFNGEALYGPWSDVRAIKTK